jgi:hypothetical protein
MKTVLKKNLIGVFALLLGIGTMSFKAWENENQTDYWYPVSGQSVGSGQIDSQCDDTTGETCAVSFSEPIDPSGMTLEVAREHEFYTGESKWTTL